MITEYWPWIAAYLSVPLAFVAAFRTYQYLKHRVLVPPFEGESPLFSVAIVLIVLLLWPVILPAVLIDQKFNITSGSVYKARDTRVLHGIVTIAEAEADGKVVDPLHRAPDLPFGHLNSAWKVFLAQRPLGCQLQWFTVPDDRNGDPNAVPKQRGYAWVRLGAVQAEFTFEWGS